MRPRLEDDVARDRRPVAVDVSVLVRPRLARGIVLERGDELLRAVEGRREARV
jgi:hypothetical protein